MCAGLHIKCLLLVAYFNQNLYGLANFHKTPPTKNIMKIYSAILTLLHVCVKGQEILTGLPSVSQFCQTNL